MIKRASMMILAGCAAVVLAGCGEREQILSSSSSKSDGKPWQGAKDEFVAKGWTPGDQKSWETQIRTRNQTQNEYVRIN